MNEQDYPPLPKAVREIITLHQPADYTEHVVTGAHYTADQMRAYVDADRAQQSAHHAEELRAYEVTVANLRAQLEQAQPYANAHDIGAGAIYDFMGWLTTRPEKLILSGSDDAAPAAEAVSAFLDKRGISKLCNPNIMGWSDAAPQSQPERKPMTPEQIETMWPSPEGTNSIHALVREVEAFHGIKETP